MRDFADVTVGGNDLLSAAAELAVESIQNLMQSAPDDVAAVFGSSSDLTALINVWGTDGPDLSRIVIVPAEQLGNADAAYAAATDTIFIADAVLETASIQRMVDILTEELGHRIDALVNSVDTSGDEGRVFAALARGDIATVTADDHATVTIDGHGTIDVETTVSVSDSGGFEGSSQTLKLETTEGGEISYRYTHYTIPDRFIIRYEGKNLLDTGFTGGSRSGTIELPKGTSDVLSVIVATDNAGTAWNYDVSVEPNECEDVDPWIISGNGDTFEHNDTTDLCEADSGVIVGRSDGSNPLVTTTGGKSTYNTDKLDVKGTEFFVSIGGESRSLFVGDFDVNLNTGIGAIKETATGTYKLAGQDVKFTSLALLSDVAAFDIEFELPSELGAIPINTDEFFNTALRFSGIGAVPLIGFKINPPGKFEIKKFLGIVDITASGVALEYRAQEDALRFQSKLEFANANWAKGSTGLQKLEADFSGMNYVQVNTDGDIDVVGVIKATTNFGFKGWSIQDLELNINTTTREIGGAGTVGTPFGVKFGEGLTVRPEVQFITSPEFELDKVGLTLDNLNKPIPAYPAFFFQRIGGSVDNFAASNTKPIELAATIGATLGPKIAGTSLALAQGDIKVNKNLIEGMLTTDILTANFKFNSFDAGKFTLAKLTGTNTLDWSKGEFKNVGTLNVLDGFYTVNNTMKFDKDFNFGFAGKAEIGIPNFVPGWAGGGQKIANSNIAIQFTADGNSSNDFAAGWGNVVVNTPWKSYNITLGLRIGFDLEVDLIGGNNIPKTSSWYISPGREYVMLSAEWENDSNAVQVQVIKPDGTVIQEADFAANRIAVVDSFNTPTSRTVIIDAPEEGTWDLEIVDTTGLGAVDYVASGEVESPGFTFTAPPTVQSDGDVDYSFEVDTPSSNVSVTFYYDDDLTELDGLFAGTIGVGDGTGNFTWDATSVVPGTYFLYALVDDGENPITIAESATAVTVGSEADVEIEIDASARDLLPGDTVTYTITATNTSTTDTAENVVAHVTLPGDSNRTAESIAGANSDFADRAYDLGDLAPGETVSMTVEMTIDSTAEASTQLSADALVLSDTYDSNPENDNDAAQSIVVSNASFGTVDLQVTNSLSSVGALTAGQQFSYDITIENVGSTDAVSVVLDEILTNATGVSMSPSFTSSFPNYSVPLPDLAPGEDTTVTVNATAEFAGTILSTSTVSADGFDVTISDNQTVADKLVQGTQPDQADLSVDISTTPSTTDGQANVAVSITNAGPGVGSSIEVEVDIPAGATVLSSNAIQGTFDSTTGIWSLGNMRDNLTRTLNLVLDGPSAVTVTAEVVGVVEDDPDSSPNDGTGDDFASISVPLGSSSLDATPGDDVLIGTGGADTVDALAGDDTITGLGGNDTITTGAGADVIIDTAANFIGDTITDFSLRDKLVFDGQQIGRDDISITRSSLIVGLDIDGDGTEDGTFLLEGNFGSGDLMAVETSTGTTLTFEKYLPTLSEGSEVASGDINGIANQLFLTGTGTGAGGKGFRATLDSKAGAQYDNAIGVYEVDGTGAIVDVQLLANSAQAGGALPDLASVEAGNQLGFFLVQDGAEWANGLAGSDTFSFTNTAGNAATTSDSGELQLRVNGVEADVTVFHSDLDQFNPGGTTHTLSGVTNGGQSLVIGFEDIVGGGDKDYQDVILEVETYIL